MNIKEIKEMINLMNENGLVELEIEKDGMRIRLKKTGSTIEGSSGPIVVEKTSLSPIQIKEETFEGLQKLAVKTIEIKAPMVGTFYRSPSPESPPTLK